MGAYFINFSQYKWSKRIVDRNLRGLQLVWVRIRSGAHTLRVTTSLFSGGAASQPPLKEYKDRLQGQNIAAGGEMSGLADLATEAMNSIQEGIDDLDAQIEQALSCPCIGTSQLLSLGSRARGDIVVVKE